MKNLKIVFIDKEKNILKAITLLKENGQKILKTSSIYKTKPYGYKEQKDFFHFPIRHLFSPLKRINLKKPYSSLLFKTMCLNNCNFAVTPSPLNLLFIKTNTFFNTKNLNYRIFRDHD